MTLHAFEGRYQSHVISVQMDGTFLLASTYRFDFCLMITGMPSGFILG
jgi:hypothetical protein